MENTAVGNCSNSQWNRLYSTLLMSQCGQQNTTAVNVMRILHASPNNNEEIAPGYAELIHDSLVVIDKEFMYLSSGQRILNLATFKIGAQECYGVMEFRLKDGEARQFDEPTNYEQDEEKLELVRNQMWNTKEEAMEYVSKAVLHSCMFTH